jgi:hypothetical protein
MLICKFRYYLCLYLEYLDDNTTKNLKTRCDMDNIYHKEKINLYSDTYDEYGKR